MQRVFQHFVEGVRASDSADKLRSVSAAAFAEFDLKAFAYFVLSATDGIDQLISTYPSAWLDHYARNRFRRIDPIVRHVRTRETPLDWHRDLILPHAGSDERRLFDDAANFGIRGGFAIPFHDNGKVAGVAFVADKPQASFRRGIDMNARTLVLMAVLVHLQASRILGQERCGNWFQLTRRELDCLRWAAQGKSASDIGCILGITRRTVSFHVENAKAKLGVRTTCQAIAKLAAKHVFDQPG